MEASTGKRVEERTVTGTRAERAGRGAAMVREAAMPVEEAAAAS